MRQKALLAGLLALFLSSDGQLEARGFAHFGAKGLGRFGARGFGHLGVSGITDREVLLSEFRVMATVTTPPGSAMRGLGIARHFMASGPTDRASPLATTCLFTFMTATVPLNLRA